MSNLWMGQVLSDNKGKFVTIELKTGTMRAVEVCEVNTNPKNTVSFKSDSSLSEPDYFTDIDNIAAIDTALSKK